MKGVKHEEF